jgi:DNA-binding phage protein
MKQVFVMALTRRFKETMVARAERDSAFVRAMLDEALTLFLNGDSDTAKAVLRDVINATIGFETLAVKVKKPSKSLHRMLSKSGNPTMDNLSAILGAMKKTLRVDIRAVVKAA